MSIADILRISETLAVSITAEETLRDAITLLSAHKTRILVVCDEDEEVTGVLSENDIIRALFEHDTDALDMKVEDFMAFDVHSCAITEEPSEVLSQMFRFNVQHFPVLENGKLAGVVTSRDIFNFVAVSPEPAK